MADIQAKEQLRRVYQRVDESTKTFIPAKPKADLYGEGHIYRVCACSAWHWKPEICMFFDC